MLAGAYHDLVVLGVGGYRAALGIALQTYVAVLVALHAGEGPIAYAALVAQGGVELALQLLRHALRMDLRQFGHLGDAPEGGSVSQVGVGEQDDGRHVLHRQTACLVGKVEAVGRGRCREHYSRAFAVAAVEGLHQVGLLGLGRQTRTRASTLYIHYYERQFGHHGQTDSFGFQAQTGTRSGRTSQVSRKGSTDSGTYAGNLVLGLDGHDVHIFACSQFVQDVGGRRDGIATQEEVLAGLLGCGDQSPCGGLVTGNRRITAVGLWLLVVGIQVNLVDRECQVLAVIIAIDEHLGVRGYQGRFLLKLILQQVDGLVHRFVEQPAYQSQRKHVAALEHRLVVHAGVFQCLFGQRGQRQGYDLYALRDAQFLKGILGVVLRLLQVLVR